jgi:hypothetical protein
MWLTSKIKHGYDSLNTTKSPRSTLPKLSHVRISSCIHIYCQSPWPPLPVGALSLPIWALSLPVGALSFPIWALSLPVRALSFPVGALPSLDTHARPFSNKNLSETVIDAPQHRLHGRLSHSRLAVGTTISRTSWAIGSTNYSLLATHSSLQGGMQRRAQRAEVACLAEDLGVRKD